MLNKKRDPFEKAVQELCYNLDRKIYLPINQFIKSINSKGETYDFGVRVAMFKGEIEKKIMELRKGD